MQKLLMWKSGKILLCILIFTTRKLEIRNSKIHLRKMKIPPQINLRQNLRQKNDHLKSCHC